jgi:pyridinium-3,5-bisthiocarboxylic acid mononucleotide nickel chelatase
MTTLFVEAFGGLAGDMFLAALLDLGDERFGIEDLRRLAEALVPGECELELTRAKRGAFEGTHLMVRTVESEDPPHRHLSDLCALLQLPELSEVVRSRCKKVLEAIAMAEGRVHGIDPAQVHFHEVGAVDTLIDVCGVLLALEALGIERVVATAPLTGEGTVRCAHGEMPVPVPAVTELMRGLPLRYGGGPGERLTPTAAALLSVLVDEFEPRGVMNARAIGLGAGTRDPQEGPPNLVRVQLCEPAAKARYQEAWLLDVHLDDATGEELGWCLRALREAGALDAWCTPLQMKKDRPGVQLSALCRHVDRPALEAVIFERTPSLGLRWTRVERAECERSFERLELKGHEIRIKLRIRPDYSGRSPLGDQDVSPEYDDLVPLAESQGWSLREAERRVLELWRSSR